MVLPKAEGRVELDASADQVPALAGVLRGAQRIVRILSDALEPALFDHDEITAELSRVARHGRQCEVRILLKDSRNLSKRSHGVGMLHRRLTSCVRILKPTLMPEDFAANYVLADESGVFFMPMEDDKFCFLNHDDRPLVKHLVLQFDDMWARAVPDPELRLMPL
jgi:hypothetical protein